MEITKKKFILYTISLLMLVGSVSFVLGGKPDEIMPLWERIWKVEEPVSIDDGDGSITIDGTVVVPEPLSVDDNGGSLTVDGAVTVSDGDGLLTVDGTVDIGSDVTLAPGTTQIPGKDVILWKEYDISPGDFVSKYIDVNGYKTIYIYIEYPIGKSIHLYSIWEWFPGSVNSFKSYTFPLGSTDSSYQHKWITLEVMSPRLWFQIGNHYADSTQVTVVAYLSPV